MSDQENPENSPQPKRSRLSRPLQPLSLPTLQRGSQTGPIKRNKSQAFAVLQGSSKFVDSIPGVISKIELRNFMCHGNFEIEFNPRINFISGANGSGKSAIQTAIAIGLGGTASKTNRSSKLEGLIKHGCNSGSVVITLANYGTKAFKPNVYGNEIRVFRNITGTTSTYRIYNQWGKLVSNKKQDLDAILLRFKIQPNNPVSILNQDMARNFLSTNKAESKYAMFKKATLLDEAENILQTLYAQTVSNTDSLETKEKSLQQTENEMKIMADKMDLVEKLKQAKKRYYDCSAEHAWSEIYRSRDEISKLEKIRDEQETIKSDLTDQVGQIIDEIASNESKIEKTSRRILALQAETRAKEDAIQKVSLDFKCNRSKYEEKCEEYQQICKKIKDKRMDRSLLQASLDDIEREEAEQKSKREMAQQHIILLRNEIVEGESKVKMLEQELSRLKNTSAHYREKKKDKERRIYNLNEEIRANEKQMNSLKTSDDLSMYAQWMPALVNRINEAIKQGRFSKPPRGPLGRYVKVRHEQWTNAIESNLGAGFLCSFFVNNINDRKELYNIMEQVIRGQKPTVHCSLFQEKERDFLSRIEAKKDSFFNMYRALDIEDTVVANFLMDMKNIHKILLVEDNASCRELAKNPNFVDNCCVIINLNADCYERGYKYYANQNRTHSRLLQRNLAHHIRSIKEDISEKKNIIAQEYAEMKEINEKCQSVVRKEEEMSQEFRKFAVEVARVRRKLSEMQNVMEIEIPSLQVKMEEMNSIEKEIKYLENAKERICEEQNRCATEMQKSKRLLDQCGNSDTIVQQSQLSAEVESYKQQVEILNRKLENIKKKVEEQNLKIENLKKRIILMNHDVETKTETASQSSSQEPVDLERRTLTEIKNELEDLNRFIKEAEGRLGNETISFQREYLEKLRKHAEVKDQVKKIKHMQDTLRMMIRERKSNIENTRDMLSGVIFAEFEKVLKSRNYRGQLQFDHNRGRLDILMAPADCGDNFMNTESLSGGEKSVSTVAFLMALWANMDLPFYSMDEYDVFMDAINRRTITGLLTSFAADKSTRQFIFLTPLDVSLIQTGPTVAVHRVKKIT